MKREAYKSFFIASILTEPKSLRCSRSLKFTCRRLLTSQIVVSLQSHMRNFRCQQKRVRVLFYVFHHRTDLELVSFIDDGDATQFAMILWSSGKLWTVVTSVWPFQLTVLHSCGEFCSLRYWISLQITVAQRREIPCSIFLREMSFHSETALQLVIELKPILRNFVTWIR